MVKVGVIGASGYAGGELLRILLNHPEVELAFATSRTYQGEYLFRAHPNLRGFTEMRFSPNSIDLMLKADFLFSALPHGESIKIIPELVKNGLPIVDLSADFRLKDEELYKLWYGFEHPYPDLLKKFVFSVPELNREEIRNSKLASSPGCMAITSILALVPIAKRLKLDNERIVIDSKIGSSGAGGKPSLSTHFSERFNVVRPYKPAGHRHQAEVEQAISIFAGVDCKVSMSAHAVNMVRGILCTIHTFPIQQFSQLDIWRAYREEYAGCKFIRMIKDKKGKYKLPDPKIVIGSNFCDIGFEIDDRSRRLVLLSATDNLIKGAAGNAVQTMNIMLNLREESGLSVAPIYPV